MLFHSQSFVLGFLPPVVAIYYALAGSSVARRLWLIAASVFFYAWWDWRYVPLLASLAMATWCAARLHLRGGWPGALSIGVAINLGALIVFKYADFLGHSVAGDDWRAWHLALPLGISFFVFQKIGYLVDLERGDRHGYGLLDFALFVAFFPTLIAGPLVRHREIIPQFGDDPRGPRMWENIGRGAVLFVIGMAKKLAIADSLAPFVDTTFAAAGSHAVGAAQAWAAVGGYTLQIYFDFSGYTDMAIGLALMLGFVLPENFRTPYRAISVRDFWRRWHMTLSRFLRDYVYIPLGGNRRGAARQAINVVATMLLGGLWHGANWTFVAWGGAHGLALAVNARVRVRVPWLVAWALTLLFVMLAWVLFRSPDFATAARLFASMAGADGVGRADGRDGWLLAVAAVLAMTGPTSVRLATARIAPRPWLAVPAGLGLAALLLLSGGRLHEAFIYFQF